ncbi:hypothetical protein [Cerasicoccus arenae]|uniref:Secreted protein n=1 Tax=Cerasicoccus arenae TaxID=424488 RepID=A0A8J3DAK5_9BACT|nr:hypothetical protein [Cerasicoccus arenae]MBK1857513.1 hypothetical protein [Cerasicoccus arenae]GHB95447.1 hypothetical protein GCM10007047_09020 [Cerasicoccus arenae]
MNRLIQCSLITAAAFGLFVGLRSLPDAECGFLHYEPPVVDGDGIQFCGSDQPVFIEVRSLQYPVDFKLMTQQENHQVGEPVNVTLEIGAKGGRAITPNDLAVTHTELMHVLVVDPSREDYHHIHPTPVGLSGQWQFSFTPRRPGPYEVFAEIVPLKTRQVVIAVGQIEVAGAPAPEVPIGLPGGWTAALLVEPAVPTVNNEARLQLSIAREDGVAAVLEPVMGAYAHLVAFDEGVSGFAHLHPKYTGREKNAAPQLDFVLNTHVPGDYRVWAQVKVDGVERFMPFSVRVN